MKHIIKVGNKDVKFVRVAGEVVYPSYVKDGLVLWYDFSGRSNTDTLKGIAEDLSGNGNDGSLQNFAFDEGSGYAGNGLEFDGVDDRVVGFNVEQKEAFTWEIVLRPNQIFDEIIFGSKSRRFYFRTRPEMITYSIDVTDSLGNRRQLLLSAYSKQVTDSNRFSTTLVLESGAMRIYLNGALADTTYFDGEEAETVNIDRLGYWRDTFGYMDGKIDSFRLYNRALSTEEIAQNYKIDKHRFNIQEI